jgi:SAM-dependent methyltransferase
MSPELELEVAHARIRELGESFYGERLADYGPTARGVGWNSIRAQEMRFDELLKVCDGAVGTVAINDYGCGCGALYSHLRKLGLPFTYTGFDLSPTMIAEAKALHGRADNVRFTTDERELEPADFSIASGVFGKRFTLSEREWSEYVLATMDRLAELSNRGFAFNMLTSYSDAERMQEDLYYADPTFYFEQCMARYSRRVTLLHHYELYDFTILVLLGDRHPPRSEPH